MKCLSCNECTDKDICAKANGMDKIPHPLVEYPVKLCMTPSVLHYIKELKNQTNISSNSTYIQIVDSYSKRFDRLFKKNHNLIKKNQELNNKNAELLELLRMAESTNKDEEYYEKLAMCLKESINKVTEKK